MMWKFTINPDTDRRELLKEFVNDLSFWGPLLEVEKKSNHPLFLYHQTSTMSSTDQVHTAQKSNMSDASSRNGKPIWRTAVDATSGKTYYYDAVTRRTQWEKPAEIRERERQRRQEKKRMDKAFFAQMEQNIRDSLQRGQIVPGCSTPKPVVPPSSLQQPELEMEEEPESSNNEQQQQQATRCNKPLGLPPIRSRTISSMDANLLRELNSPVVPAPVVQKQPSLARRDAHGRPPLPARSNKSLDSQVSLEFSPEEARTEKETLGPSFPPPPQVHPLTREESDQTELRGEALLDGLLLIDDEAACEADFVRQQALPVQQPNQHVRRNTGTTIYAASTMMNPDVEKTIKCVCGVYRAHIVQAASKRSHNSPTAVAMSPNNSLAGIFLDNYGMLRTGDTHIPSLDDIIAFYQDFYVRSQMEHDTIIMSLIYVERLIKEDTAISPLPINWRSVLFSCMVLASKVWDDLSMWNIDFSNVCGRGGCLVAYTLPRINQLELALLKALNFNVKVPASEYAKYYFLIRSMLIKSGLLSEEKPTTPNKPSNQQQLQSNNPSGEALMQREKQPARHRGSRSMNDYMWMEQEQLQQQKVGSSVCLEQLLSMTTY